LRVVEMVAAVNDVRKRAMARKVAATFGGSVHGKAVTVPVLTFKPNTDDMRDAPSIPLITALQDMGVRLCAYDPVGMVNVKRELTKVEFADSAYACAQDADALVIVTEQEQFRALDLGRRKVTMKQSVLVDLLNVYRHDEVAPHGFAYDSIGQPSRR
jgi:UDPglucose 6-dehydrogenase